MGQQLYFDNYTPAADIVVLAVCFVMAILLATSYVTKNKTFIIFVNIIGYLVVSSLINIILHDYYTHITDGNYFMIYVLHVIYHAILFSLFLVYIVYFVTVLDLDTRERIPVMTVSTLIYIVVILTDIYTTYMGTGFRLNKNGTALSGINVFFFGYLAFLLVVIYLMAVYGSRLYRNTMLGIAGTIIVSFIILFNQGRHGQISFTVATFLFPAIAIMYLLHSNPFGVKTGTISVSVFSDAVRYHHSKKRPFYFVSVYFHDFKSDGAQLPKELQRELRQFPSRFFKKSVLFRIANGHLLLLIPEDKNPDFDEKIRESIEAFKADYDQYHFDYKMVIGHSIDEISQKNEYLTLIKSIHRRMVYNTIYRVSEDDIKEFNRFEDILKELEDIYKKNDLNDKRILAFFQPVLNVKSGRYDTAEALMRLNLPNLGMVYPNEFIHIAEDYGYIHVLTKIILNKTCISIKDMLDDGYDVNRISVNVSVPELREAAFIQELEGIISSSGIPNGKIAIEITESQTESDIIVITNLVEQLKKVGVTLYLDDFGTGYSNMERIMKLPFDIIKFDRSLVLASKYDKRSEAIVGRLAKMFADLDYSVLYEGVENEKDEIRCKNMSATYLQGYKYSRPIPITVLKQFFSKAV